MTLRPAAVVFDVDGTLVDSERHGHRLAFNTAFAEAGLPYEWGEEEYGQLLATPGGRRRIVAFLVRQGHDQAEADELAGDLHARKTELFCERAAAGDIPPRPGVVRLLDELAAAGVPLGVATTGSRVWVEPLLDRLFGRSRFAAVVAGDDVAVLKPDPSAYLEVVDRLASPVAGVVAVEDSANGVTAATGAGLACLAVVNDYTRGQDVGGAALVVDGFGRPGRARVLAGSDEALEDGAVTLATVQHLAG